VLLGQDGPVFAVAISPDSRHVVSGGRDGRIGIWELGGERTHRFLTGHEGIVWSIAFTPDGNRFLTAGADGVIRIWELHSGRQLGMLGTTDRTPAPVAANDNGRGAKLFRKCAACHTLEREGAFKAGPTLYGLFGRLAGTVSGYPYSDALKRAKIVWTEQTVDALFSVGPETLTPGSKMPLQRMPNAKDRSDLIQYLKQVTAKDASR